MKKIILSLFVMFMMIFGVSINAETNIYPEPKLTAEKSITLDQKNVNVNLSGFGYNLETETTGASTTEISLNPYYRGYNKSAKFEKLVIPYLTGKSVSKPNGIVGVKVTCDCKLNNEDYWTTNALIAEHFFNNPGEDFVLTKQQISDLFDSTYTSEQAGRDQVGQDLPEFISFMFYITEGTTINDGEKDYQVLSSDDKPIVMTYGIDYNTILYDENGFLGNSQLYLYNFWYGKYKKDGTLLEWVGPKETYITLKVPYNTTTSDVNIIGEKKHYKPGDDIELEFTLKNVKDFKNYKLWLETNADGLIAIDNSAGGVITEANWSGDQNQFSTNLKDDNGWLLINGQQSIKFTKKFKISDDYDKDSIAVDSVVKYDGADNGNGGNTLTIKLGEDESENGGHSGGVDPTPGNGGPSGELKPLPETGSEFLMIGLILVSISGLGFISYRKFLN